MSKSQNLSWPESWESPKTKPNRRRRTFLLRTHFAHTGFYWAHADSLLSFYHSSDAAAIYLLALAPCLCSADSRPGRWWVERQNSCFFFFPQSKFFTRQSSSLCCKKNKSRLHVTCPKRLCYVQPSHALVLEMACGLLATF